MSTTTPEIPSTFEELRQKIWSHRFSAEIFVPIIMGGIPFDQKVAEGWIKTKMGLNDDALVQEAVAKTMVEMGVTLEKAVEEVDKNKHLNGFKRDKNGFLYYEGRCLKAALKEAISVAADAGNLQPRGMGLNNRKGVLSFCAEHVMVAETELSLGVKEPTGILQKFVHTYRGSGIQYEEYVENATIRFTVMSDFDFDGPKSAENQKFEEFWGTVMVTMEKQGIGASRSQGYGTFTTTKWQRQTPLVMKNRKK